LLLGLQISLAQEKPQARKVDQFGKLPCDDFKARIDQFSNELIAQPKSVGYAVINRNTQNKDDLALGLRTRNLIFGILESRKYEPFKVGNREARDFSIELWIVPLGAEVPFSLNEDWTADFPRILKPRVYDKTWLNDGVCPDFSLITFAEMLLNNRNVSGNIVILAPTKKKFSQFEQEILENLAQKYNLPPNRFKTFFVRQPEIVGFEYWLVPKKR
jgi:hypothetical protein